MNRLLLPLLLLVACSHPAPSQSQSPPPSWHVSNGFIRDESGRAVILRGANVSGMNKQKPYFDFHQPPDFQRMRDAWGFNSMRLITVWAAIEPQKGQYDEAYLDQLALRAEWAQQLGLSVIVDMHEDIYGEGFGFDGAPAWACDASHYANFTPKSPWFSNQFDPNVEACVDDFYANAETQAHFQDAWVHVAQRLSGISSVIGFDLLNEPEWGTDDPTQFEAERLQPMYERVVPAVRAVAPHWLAFLEPSGSRNIGIPTGLQPFPFPDVVYAPHSYNGLAEAGQPFSADDRAGMLMYDATLGMEAKQLNAALWIGEYGGKSNAGIVDYMTAEYDGIGAVAGSSAYWDYSRNDDGYGILNADGTEKAPLLSALVRPYPSRTAGDPVSYAYDASSSTFTFVYVPDPKISAATEIIVPPRLYPNGYQVDCGGCAYQKASSGLSITHPGAGAQVTVTLHP